MDLKRLILFFIMALGLVGSGFAILTSTDTLTYYTWDNVTTDLIGSDTLTNSGATYNSSGKINGAYLYDGINDYMTRASESLGIANNWTTNIWIYWLNTSESSTIYRFSSSLTNLIAIETISNNSLRFITGDSAGSLLVNKYTSPITSNTWHMITMTWDGNRFVGYIDGIVTNNATYSGTMTSTNRPRYFATETGTGMFFYGLLDEFSLWNDSLTYNEVQELYNSGSGLRYPYNFPTISFSSIIINNKTMPSTNYFNYSYLDIQTNITNSSIPGTSINTTAYVWNISSSTLVTSYQVNGTNQSNFTFMGLLDDDYYINFYATNGSYTAITTNYTFYIDTITPVINFSNLSATYNSVTPPTLNVSIVDLYPNVCTYALDNLTPGNCNTSNYLSFTPSSLSEGNHTLYVNATDSAGNKNVSNYTFDYQPYRITLIFRNILTLQEINNISFGDLNFSGTIYLTNLSSNLTLYHNPGLYNYTANKTGFVSKSGTYLIENITQTQYIDMFPIFNINLKDEITLQDFNISGTDSIYLRVTCEDESVVQYEITSVNHSINISCTYLDFRYIINYVDNSYYRTLVLDDQETNFTVYLIDLLTTQSIFNSFKLFDLLSEYENIRVTFYKPIGNELVQITGDSADAANKVPAYLVLGDQYIIKITSDNQPEKNLGKYSADIAGEIVLTLFDLTFSPSSQNKYTYINRDIYNNETHIFALYEDQLDDTDSVTFTLRQSNKYGVVLYTATSNVNNVTFTYVIPPAEENYTFYAELVYTHNTFGSDSMIKILKPNGRSVDLGYIFENVNLDWIITLVLSFLALTLTISNANTGAVIFSGLGALLVVFGWYSIGWIPLSIAIIISVGNLLMKGGRD